MPNLKLLEKYASLICEIGINVQKGQTVAIEAPVESYVFARMLVEKAYLKGASEVIVVWGDQSCARYSYIHGDSELVSTVKPWVEKRYEYIVDKSVCRIAISAVNSKGYEGVEPKKLQQAITTMQANQFIKAARKHYMSNQSQWVVVCAPTASWAKQVFPQLNEEEAIEALWNAIFSASRVREDNDPVQEWKDHMANLSKRNEILNNFDFVSLHFKNKLGTDLIVGLVDQHVWRGGQDYTLGNIKVPFAPNIPTEESFTMPHKYNVNGTVVATKPLNYLELIKDFSLVFENGKVVSHTCQEGESSLINLLDSDEGSRYIGEVALIDHNSPISQSGILFFNTLFDENASCHLALGASYASNVVDGDKLDDESAEKIGSNRSRVHVDFMFGSSCMEVVGTKKDGSKVTIIKNGNFIL